MNNIKAKTKQHFKHLQAAIFHIKKQIVISTKNNTVLFDTKLISKRVSLFNVTWSNFFTYNGIRVICLNLAPNYNNNSLYCQAGVLNTNLTTNNYKLLVDKIAHIALCVLYAVFYTSNNE